MLTPLTFAAAAGIGALIGAAGIGGVLLPPALNALGGVEMHAAIPACMLAYLGSGAVGTWLYARHGAIDWRLAAGICAGGAPGAYCGAYLLPHASAAALEWGIAALLVGGGWYALAQPRAPVRGDSPAPVSPSPTSPSPRALTLTGVGFVVGLGSALTGTGGPMLLIPLLVWLRVPMLAAVGLAQVIQLPVAALATLGNAAHGEVDWRLSAALAVALIGGVVAGARVAHRLPTATLAKLVAALMIAAGLLFAGGLAVS